MRRGLDTTSQGCAKRMGSSQLDRLFSGSQIMSKMPFWMTLVSDYVIENTFEIEETLDVFKWSHHGVRAVDKRTGEHVDVVYVRNDHCAWSCGRDVMHLLKFLSRKPPMFPGMLGLSCVRDPTQNALDVFIAYRGWSVADLSCCLEMEMRGVPLDGWSWTSKLKCIFGIAAAMCVLHGENWVHCGLTPRAVLLDNNFEPYLGGTSLQDMKEVSQIQPGHYGSLFYLAPELFSGDRPCDKASDVYSFGMVLYSLFADKFRLEDFSSVPRRSDEVPEYIRKLEDGTRYMRTSGVPEFLWQMITQCWDADPERRPSFREIVHRLHESRDQYISDEEMDTDADAVIQYQARVLDLISKYL